MMDTNEMIDIGGELFGAAWPGRPNLRANQFDNLANRLAHYETTGPEIWEQKEGKVTHLVVGVGAPVRLL